VPQKKLPLEITKNNKLPVTKLDAARRQLETAVTLWFHDGDPISVHTLAMAAHEILRAINRSRNGRPMLTEPCEHIRSEYQEAWRELRVASYLFFKHGSKDADEIHHFPPSVNKLVMLDAVEIYQTLTGDHPATLVTFTWYMAEHHPHLFSVQLPALEAGDLDVSGWSKKRFFTEFLPLVGRNTPPATPPDLSSSR
jgi:hypothetical protein